MCAEIANLQKDIKIKARDISDLRLHRHLALIKESQYKVEIDKLKRKGKLEGLEEKYTELERHRVQMATYDVQIDLLADEALDLHRRIVEVEAEDLHTLLQRLQAALEHPGEGQDQTAASTDALSRQASQLTAEWIRKKGDAVQLQDKDSSPAREWKTQFLNAIQ